VDLQLLVGIQLEMFTNMTLNLSYFQLISKQNTLLLKIISMLFVAIQHMALYSETVTPYVYMKIRTRTITVTFDMVMHTTFQQQLMVILY
jgi:hypothetical protein